MQSGSARRLPPPSPSGRGQGEGALAVCDDPQGTTHPASGLPLPEGEARWKRLFRSYRRAEQYCHGWLLPRPSSSTCAVFFEALEGARRVGRGCPRPESRTFAADIPSSAHSDADRAAQSLLRVSAYAGSRGVGTPSRDPGAPTQGSGATRCSRPWNPDTRSTARLLARSAWGKVRSLRQSFGRRLAACQAAVSIGKSIFKSCTRRSRWRPAGGGKRAGRPGGSRGRCGQPGEVPQERLLHLGRRAECV